MRTLKCKEFGVCLATKEHLIRRIGTVVKRDLSELKEEEDKEWDLGEIKKEFNNNNNNESNIIDILKNIQDMITKLN